MSEQILSDINKYKNSEGDIINLFKKNPEIVGKYVKIFIILTTCPLKGSGNVGDRLITESCKNLMRDILQTGDNKIYFYEFFRKDNLDPHLAIINNSKGIVLPGFPIRPNLYRDIYTLTTDLKKIKVPFIPVGAGECSIPGTQENILNKKYNKQTINFLKYVVEHSKNGIGCRDPLVQHQLKCNGIKNTIMVGDCGWYDINKIGDPVKYNGLIQKIVFTEPHNVIYQKQVFTILDTITKLFPDAIKIYSQHSKENSKTKIYEKYARDIGFVIRRSSHDVKNIRFYKDCDLHIGYRVHGYIAFLRNRIPAILFMEDGRGVGQGNAFDNIGCINAFENNSEKVVPNMELSKILTKYIKYYRRTKFKDFYKALKTIDTNYENMRSFLIKSVE